LRRSGFRWLCGLWLLALALAAQAGDGARIRAAIEAGLAATQVAGLDHPRLRTFYEPRALLPAWHDALDGQRKANAGQLRAALADSASHGLDPAEYHLGEITALWPSTRPEDRARLDLLLSDAFFRYASNLYQGHSRPADVDPDWHIAPNRLDVVAFLSWVIDSTDFAAVLARLAPPHPGYHRLRAALARYRGLAELGGWTPIDPGPTLHPGERGLRVEALRRRLWQEGHLLDEAADPFLFDAALEAAVRRFQRLHTLEDDGLVGAATLAALNVPLAARIEQIRLNLERWRWLPRDLGPRHLLVNMAGFELEGYVGEERRLAMRVIIGRPFRSTPAFSGRLSHVVFNPYWNVPRRIAEEDLVPAQLREPDYLAARGFHILDSWRPDARELDPAQIDWRALSGRRFPYRLRQDPGPQNSLGRIKFMLPNPFAIYLHDTPARHLFQRTVRTFSSGCIRVEAPDQLVLFLFQGVPGWDQARVRALLDAGETVTEYLPEPVPVYLVYLTAWVDAQGALHFADDIYARDAALAARLSDS